MKRATSLLLALVALALTLAACGGGGSSDDARTLIRQTFANPKKIRSGNVSLNVRIRTQGSQALDKNPIDLRFNGPFERTSERAIPRFAFTLTAGAGGRSFTAGATSTGKAGYLALQGRDYALPGAQYASFRKSFETVTKAASSPGRSANLPWFENPKVAGEQDVGGTTTQHVTGDVNLGKVVDSIQNSRRKGAPKITATQRRQFEQVIRDPSFEFWTGKDDHLLRRVRVTFRFAIPAESQSQLGGVKSAGVTLDYQLAALNQPQQIPTPAKVRPISQLSAQLQSYAQTLQGLLSGIGSSGGSSGQVSPQTSKYAQCLQSAGDDVAKQQACASLLGK